MAGPNALTVASIKFPKTYDSTLATQVTISGANLPQPGADSMGANGGFFSFGNGSGAADTLSAATLSAILPDGALKQLLAKTFTDDPVSGLSAAQQLQAAIAVIGAQFQTINGASAINPNIVSGQRPFFDVTTTGASGVLLIKLDASIAK